MRSYRRSIPVASAFAVLALLALTGCTAPAGSQPTGVPQPVTTVTAGPTATDIGGFTHPTAIVAPDDGSGRLFVAEQKGIIRVVRGGSVLKTPALDISGQVGSAGAEQGLLGLAFPAGYAQKSRAYIYFTDRSGNTKVYRVHASASDPDTFDPATMQLILSVPQPYANHNGGQLAFGPDGFLYIGLGDGGGAGDPGGRAQDLGVLLGKILRIDPESTPDAPGYKVPSDNPFVNRAGAKAEIWEYGLRNPWRFSFDSANGDLWIGDVGQDAWEEVDHVAGGKGGLNFGWPLYEGLELYKATTKATTGYVWPVFWYTHRQGISVTGGYVYHGKAHPNMDGLYVFGDYGSGKIWTLRKNDAVATKALGTPYAERIARETFYKISTFGVDGDGELWLADYAAGLIHMVDDLSR